MRHVSIFLFLAAVLIARPAWSSDNDLKPLADALAHVRSAQSVNRVRDAGPELTPVKQTLRAWLENQLPIEPSPTGPDQPVYLPNPSELAALSERLNRDLNGERLTCGDVASAASRCASGSPGQDDARGYVGEVHVSSLDDGRYLLAVTAVGVRCGFDESAYIYRRGPDRKWSLLLQSEQDRYGEDEYAPQNFLSISVSPSDVPWNEPAPPPLVLTLGYSPWCSSNWQSLSTRLWRASTSTPTPGPLIDKKDTLYIGDDQIASARLTQKDLVIQYRGQSIDGATLIRSHVEHYLIGEGDKVERIAPVALNPNDFVEEWLTSDWPEAERWIDASGDKSALAKLHSASPKELGEFDGPPTRCRSDPTLWQVSFAASEGRKQYRLSPSTHFLVRWIAPYRFSLIRAQQRSFQGCNVPAAMPDDLGTLFPIQGWRP